jgi:hypothetical protein
VSASVVRGAVPHRDCLGDPIISHRLFEVAHRLCNPRCVTTAVFTDGVGGITLECRIADFAMYSGKTVTVVR